MFCGCRADYFGAEPNTHTCPVCLGLPGALPVPNRVAVEHGLRLALALGAEVPERLVFHRKNYFYPDLPKNYQISQYDLPLGRGEACLWGSEGCASSASTWRKTRGKASTWRGGPSWTSTGREALIELVTEPDLKTPEEARLFLQRIQALVQTLGISDASPKRASSGPTSTSPCGGWGSLWAPRWRSKTSTPSRACNGPWSTRSAARRRS